ncbi:unnamed protein product [Allacma fusca]|uniref:Centrosomal CEP44 domain-containing protein n=1 Tax=Allacma fusca TaxID=39272 RepID=A0A8J2MC65_9HEXA|nr:unnamed protein product [Allacma fusca]
MVELTSLQSVSEVIIADFGRNFWICSRSCSRKMSRQKSVRFVRDVNGQEEVKPSLEKSKSRTSYSQIPKPKGQNRNSDWAVNRKKKITVSTSTSTTGLLNIKSKSALRRSSRSGSRLSSELSTVYLDHPEIIKNKAKKLLGELEKNHISLSEASIERIILGDPKEYLHVIKRIFQSCQVLLKAYFELKNIKWSFPDLLAKFDGRITKGVNALYAALAQILNVKPSLNPVQFMQNRFTIQKLNLCIDIIEKLSSPMLGNYIS